jgi:hypothetical protein
VSVFTHISGLFWGTNGKPRIFIVGIMALVISLVSLWLAYGPLTSPLWQLAYAPRNTAHLSLVLEWFRVFLLWAIASICISTIFEESLEICKSDLNFKKALIIIGSLAFVGVVLYNIFGGPYLLTHNPNVIKQYPAVPLFGSNYFDLAVKPYLAYLPYSLISYVFLYTPMALLSAFILRGEYKDLAEKTQTVRDRFAVLQQDGVDKTVEHLNIMSAFMIYRSHFEKFLSKFNWVMLSVFMLICFEALLGLKTLSGFMKVFSFVTYGTIGIMILAALFPILAYDKFFHETKTVLYSVPGSLNETQNFHKANASFGLIIHSLFYSVPALLIFVLLIILSVKYPIITRSQSPLKGFL